MTAAAPANDNALYEILSRDAVRQMHEKFISGVEERAKKAVPAEVKDPKNMVDSLMALLLAAAQKAIEIKSDELAGLAKNGKRAVDKRTAEVKKALHSKLPDYNAYPSPKFSKLQEIRHSIAKTARHEDAVVQKVFGDQERIYLRMTGGADASLSDTQQAIAVFLAQKGYRITDYKKGYATDAKGKQQFRIGKLLKEEAELYQGFMDDSTRTLGTLFAVISRNADDIAHMSTGRAWGSCMGSGGFNYGYVPKDIRKGSLIAYMISEKDPDIVNPLARILIKPFRKEADSTLSAIARTVFGPMPEQIFVPDKTYGIHNDAFTAVVTQFVEEKLNRGKEGMFALASGLYSDGCGRRQARKNEKTEPLTMFNYY